MEVNPLLRFPSEIQEEVENLRLNKQAALMITKIIESKYLHKLQELGMRSPTFNDIKKYLKWAKANRGVPTKDAGYSATDAFAEEMNAIAEAKAEEMGGDVTASDLEHPAEPTAEDLSLVTEIDLSTPKTTLDDVKKRIQLTIFRLEKLRIKNPGVYNDRLEVNLKNYYIELANLTHTEVKMAEELRDSDKIDVTTVNFLLNKLFQCVGQAIQDTAPEKRDLFFSVLKSAIKYAKNEYLEQAIKGDISD